MAFGGKIVFCPALLSFFFFKNFYLSIYLSIDLFIRERGREGEREGEKYQCVVACCMPLTGDLAHNPGMCPDWESNQRFFGSWASTQSTEPHQPGLQNCLAHYIIFSISSPSPKFQDVPFVAWQPEMPASCHFCMPLGRMLLPQIGTTPNAGS